MQIMAVVHRMGVQTADVAANVLRFGREYDETKQTSRTVSISLRKHLGLCAIDASGHHHLRYEGILEELPNSTGPTAQM
jgi:hypothetical protein